MSNITKFLVSIAGYSGPAITLVCAYDQRDDVLIIAQEETPLVEERREGFGMVTNLNLSAIDLRFDDLRLRDSIRDYFRRTSQDTIDLIDKLARHSPDNAVTNDGFDDHGPRFRIAPDITNGQIAVFAACSFAGAQSPISAAISMMDDISELYSIVTI
jgi:hypothetical protein